MTLMVKRSERKRERERGWKGRIWMKRKQEMGGMSTKKHGNKGKEGVIHMEMV